MVEKLIKKSQPLDSNVIKVENNNDSSKKKSLMNQTNRTAIIAALRSADKQLRECLKTISQNQIDAGKLGSITSLKQQIKSVELKAKAINDKLETSVYKKVNSKE